MNSSTLKKVQATLEVGDRKAIFKLADKVFSTGSTGLFATGKMTGPEGTRYQVTIFLVEIGTKPKD